MAHGERVALEIRPRYTNVVGVGGIENIVIDPKEYRVVAWGDPPKDPAG